MRRKDACSCAQATVCSNGGASTVAVSCLASCVSDPCVRAWLRGGLPGASRITENYKTKMSGGDAGAFEPRASRNGKRCRFASWSCATQKGSLQGAATHSTGKTLAIMRTPGAWRTSDAARRLPARRLRPYAGGQGRALIRTRRNFMEPGKAAQAHIIARVAEGRSEAWRRAETAMPPTIDASSVQSSAWKEHGARRFYR